MKLFYAPEFSSIADHIPTLEAGPRFDLVKVDIWTKQIEGGGSYTDINPEGYILECSTMENS
jgi:glutathione S-transferase